MELAEHAIPQSDEVWAYLRQLDTRTHKCLGNPQPLLWNES
jgi:hypothetical protein